MRVKKSPEFDWRDADLMREHVLDPEAVAVVDVKVPQDVPNPGLEGPGA